MRTLKFGRIIALATAVVLPGVAHSVQAPNPRAVVRADGGASRAVADTNRNQSRRSADSVARTATSNVVRPARSGVVPAQSVSDTNRSTVVRSAVNHTARNATQPTSVARNATTSARTARAARNTTTARATALFSDTSKIGGGYTQCREAYATCMDQFCGSANDTYRRCFCSERFTDFRNTEAALDQAKVLLQQFEDNNLNAVGMSADEVSSMYKATVGENAIKRDTSAAQSVLNQIGDLLSGKTRVETKTSNSLGLLSLDFSADIGDIWGDNSGSNIFGTNSSGPDMSKMEGAELYNASSNQCSQITADSCSSEAMFNMAKSSYSILISQDCNAYEKKINAQREAVSETVRTAEKYLREARLEDYRAHNSADVNDCLDKVRRELQKDTACGANYVRCLDYTGAYVDQSTGEPIYTPRLFQLTDLIKLDGAGAGTDILSQNPQFNQFLESRKMFATTALDSCRGIADKVWNEFKRAAIIEIAQAQDAKIEEVKMSCVSTMKECYDEIGGQLKSFDDTAAQRSGAIAAITTQAMCADKVIACASLYGDTTGCKFDGNGKLTKGNQAANASGKAMCGLDGLLNFVNNVDDTRVAEGCATAVNNYLKDLCTPSADNMGYPWNCRTLTLGNVYGNNADNCGQGSGADLSCLVRRFATANCTTGGTYNNVSTDAKTMIERALEDVQDEMREQLAESCETLNGMWFNDGGSGTKLSAFYSSVYGGNETTSWGACYENTEMLQCISYNTNNAISGDMATWNPTTQDCEFTDAWYDAQCTNVNGVFENGICYVMQ